jgi:hypothetical protein
VIVKALLVGTLSSLFLYLMYNHFTELPKTQKIQTLKFLGKGLVFVCLAVFLLAVFVLLF